MYTGLSEDNIVVDFVAFSSRIRQMASRVASRDLTALGMVQIQTGISVAFTKV